MFTNNGYISSKKCVRGNHVPRRTPYISHRRNWQEHYKPQLINLFKIFMDIINDRYPRNKVEINSKTFNDFCIFIYESSSKYME